MNWPSLRMPAVLTACQALPVLGVMKEAVPLGDDDTPFPPGTGFDRGYPPGVDGSSATLLLTLPPAIADGGEV